MITGKVEFWVRVMIMVKVGIRIRMTQLRI